MTKAKLIERVATKTNLTKDKATIIVNSIFDSMVDAMRRGERIEIRNFGNFAVKSYRAYRGRNPKSGDIVEVPPKRLPYFKVGLELRRLVNRGK